MGGCFSLHTIDASESPTATAKVVSLQGHLLEYNLPISVSEVIVGQAKEKADQSSHLPSCFVCNSDRLLYDEFIPALDMEEQLQADQIYFLLPASKLQYRLSASDMAALAVKASLALQNASKSKGRKKSRISPAPAQASVKSFDLDFERKAPPPPFVPPKARLSRSGSVRRLQRYTSRRAKLAVRSFRLRLSTIYEGIVL